LSDLHTVKCKLPRFYGPHCGHYRANEPANSTIFCEEVQQSPFTPVVGQETFPARYAQTTKDLFLILIAGNRIIPCKLQ